MSTRAVALLALGVVAFLVLPNPAEAQSIGSGVAQAPDGVVTMSFAARDGVCGRGRNIQMRESRNEYWERDCEHGPVRVLLTKRGGRIADIDTYVGGRWRSGVPDATDLGTVSAPDAADYLMGLVGDLDGEVAKDAIFPALIADSAEVWPELLRIARSESIARSVRKNAVFWVGQAASEEAVRGLTDLVDRDDSDVEIQRQAVFALSQLPSDQGVPILIRLAQTHERASVRKRAMFWLGQSEDPRALALFEAILLRKP